MLKFYKQFLISSVRSKPILMLAALELQFVVFHTCLSYLWRISVMTKFSSIPKSGKNHLEKYILDHIRVGICNYLFEISLTGTVFVTRSAI